ncbi:MAG: T9SS type A sorting domain-containing protein [Saprospiraceae bacterium]
MMHQYYKFVSILLSLMISGYNSAQGWKILKSLPDSASERHHPVTFAQDGFGFVGLGSSPTDFLEDFYRYNPAKDEWTGLRKFPGGPRTLAIGLNYNNKAFAGFGVDSNGTYKSDLWEYYNNTDTWVMRDSCPCEGRIHPALVAVNNKIFVGLGFGATFMNLNDWWEYSIDSNKWRRMADFPGSARHHPYQFGIEPYAYVGMGHGEMIYNDLYRFDPSNNSWKEMLVLPDEGRVAGTQFNFNGKGYILSGQGDDHGYMDEGEFYEYDPIGNSWKQLTPHPGGSRWAPGSFMIDDKVYFTCGEDEISYKKDLMMYDFDILKTKQINDEENISIHSISDDHIIIQSKSSKIKSINVYQVDGKLVLDNRIKDKSSNSAEIDISQFISGVYIIKLEDDHNRTYAYKISKK